eukprot:CAMPEP_0195006420 /NCGR_PEP_ID=MMETSP0326_2-20130528/6683_1 /TAXON_ID=2866 ORGANISM="Crypthecodinium cohnii, Strain Seligo" /NCGR_SAMPLE_ID=MMETSP0326_2 /ASSEMBLY_ACC=CAM_ASM_000348 /LENGTH=33 /DNA_ID= /DNA_START= /DNA_END= /DNA_ORIENTATION=
MTEPSHQHHNDEDRGEDWVDFEEFGESEYIGHF